jgi:RNA polymerase sigma-70 factor (ECF subfamily)
VREGPGCRQDGSSDRFREFFDQHQQALLSYGLRRCHSAADAADLVAETMLVAWRRLDDVPPGPDALPWLYGAAWFVLANQRRGHRRADRLSARLASDLEDLVADTTQTSADRAWVGDALATLNDLDREVLTLTLWEGLSPAQVAVAMDVPAATVRTRLHRARRRVREALEASACERLAVAGHNGLDEQPLACDREEMR